MTGRGWWLGAGRRLAGRSEAAGSFGALGLTADAALTDDEVRMAWRRVAAATPPDRADGRDPAAFATAAAAYSLLRTRSGRGEALAGGAGGLTGQPGPQPGGRRWTLRWASGQAAELAWRIRRGRPWRLAARVTAAAALSA